MEKSKINRGLFNYFDEGATGGHSGTNATRHRMASLLYWKGMNVDIKQWIQECIVCQHYKYNTTSHLGLFQPLPLPSRIWSAITMDFIEELPSSKGNDTILMVIIRLTNYDHFIALAHPYTVASVAV
ncbi:Transposon Ty3-I Gag-Pol polyprotein [Gossypium australe]|uniref:Transposon Ty3-I Gag-Pol polyprotein n=1 Tax=Gossypium australe TaxID=47621 RepID=A0A5B6WSW8_9ROSI|nr:Transposon Ty3-I Gag-Pol polyprotein [Gossypium australe]